METKSLVTHLHLITYVNILCAYVLNVQGRAWAVTRVTLVGIAVVATLNLTLLRPVIRWLGMPGAGGVACALAMLASESAVTFWMLRAVGGRVFDRRSRKRAARTGLAALATVFVHLVAAPLGPWRLLLDAACYVSLALVTGAVEVRQCVAFVRAAYQERRDRSGA